MFQERELKGSQKSSTRYVIITIKKWTKKQETQVYIYNKNIMGFT